MSGKRQEGRLNSLEGKIYKRARQSAFAAWQGAEGERRRENLYGMLAGLEMPEGGKKYWLGRLRHDDSARTVLPAFLDDWPIFGPRLDCVLPVAEVLSWRRPGKHPHAGLVAAGDAMRLDLVRLFDLNLGALARIPADAVAASLEAAAATGLLEKAQSALWEAAVALDKLDAAGRVPLRTGQALFHVNRKIAAEWERIVAPVEVPVPRGPTGPATDLYQLSDAFAEFTGIFWRAGAEERKRAGEQPAPRRRGRPPKEENRKRLHREKGELPFELPSSGGNGDFTLCRYVGDLAFLWEHHTGALASTGGNGVLSFQEFVAGAVGYLAGLSDACRGVDGLPLGGNDPCALAEFERPPARQKIQEFINNYKEIISPK